MTKADYIHILSQIETLKEVLKEYGDRTLGNAIMTLTSRKEWWEQHNKNQK